MQTLAELIASSAVFAGMTDEDLALVAGCAWNVGFEADTVLFHEDDDADTFYLVRHGRVSLEFHTPDRGGIVIDTAEPGDVVGWSWLFPPYRWQYDARAVDAVRAVAFDGACLRGRCAEDTRLGYDLMQRFAAVMTDRLQHTRIRLLDVYGGAVVG